MAAERLRHGVTVALPEAHWQRTKRRGTARGNQPPDVQCSSATERLPPAGCRGPKEMTYGIVFECTADWALTAPVVVYAATAK
jgi:hypothetical protein